MSYDTEQDYQNQKVDLSLWKRLFGYALRNKKQLVQNIIRAYEKYYERGSGHKNG